MAWVTWVNEVVHTARENFRESVMNAPFHTIRYFVVDALFNKWLGPVCHWNIVIVFDLKRSNTVSDLGQMFVCERS